MADLKSNIAGGVLLLTLAAALFVGYDLLFSPPEHQEGIIIEKIFVPSIASAATPYGGVRRSNYFITAEKDEQWIAMVVMDNGDTLKIHCMSKHYHTKNVGDKIHFKKYEGKHLHIKYFAHNEEED